jgi:uncharacterized lipoprotein
MRSIRSLVLAAIAALAVSACRAVDRVTNPRRGYYHSETCHPDIWTVTLPRDTTAGCGWTFVVTP